MLHIFGMLVKFDKPFVRTLLGFTHINRAGCEVLNGAITYFVGVHNGLLGIVYNQLFAKCIDKMLGAPRYFYSERKNRREYYGVAKSVSPQAAIGRNDHLVVFTDFHIFQTNGFGIIVMRIFERDKLIKNTVVEHQ